MFMLVNKRPFISCANDVEMCIRNVCFGRKKIVFVNRVAESDIQNSRVMKSSYETELCKMTSHFELLTRSRKIKLTLRVTNSKSKNKNLHLELLTRS